MFCRNILFILYINYKEIKDFKMDSLEKKTILKNIGYLSVSKILVYLLSIITITLIPRYLGVTGYGQLNFVLSYIGVFGVLTTLGLNFLITRDVSRDKSKANSYFNNLFYSKVITLIIIGIIIFITTYFLNKPKIVIYLILLGIIYLFFKQLSKFIISFFNAFEKMQYKAYLDLFEKLFYTVFAIIVIVLNKGLIGVMLSKVISIFFVFLFLFYSLRKIIRIKPKLNNNFFKKTVLISWPFALSFLFYNLYFHFDRLLISFYLGDYQVGLYAIGYTFITFIIGFLTIFKQVFMPLVSKTNINKNLELLGNKLFKLITLFSIPIFFGALFLSKDIISLVFGSDYIFGNIAFKLILVFMFLFSLNLTSILFLDTKNFQKFVLKTRIIASVFNVLFNFLIIPVFGIIGAGITTIISELIILILTHNKLNKKILRIDYFKNSFKTILSGIIMIISIYLVKNFINYKIFFNSLDVIILVIIGFIIYSLSILLTKTITKKEIYNIINLVRNKSVK